MGGTKQISLPKSPLLEERSLSSSYEFTRERLSWFTGYVGRGGALSSLNLAISICKEQNTISLTHFSKWQLRCLCL